jgi:hypothetical protein
MSIGFKKLSNGWNAEPNAPDPKIMTSGAMSFWSFI